MEKNEDDEGRKNIPFQLQRLFLNLQNSKMNDSTSQIYNDNIVTNEYYLIKTITIYNILKNIELSEISLIKVDIEGGEENILNDLFDIHIKNNIPLYVSFHYSWWKDQNLDRFPFLSYDNKNKILSNPFTSILFENLKSINI
jgi:hypothetical protein